MTAPRALPLALLVGVLVAVAPAARAAFDPPVELGHGGFGTSVAAATDEGGATTAVLVGVSGGPQLMTRASSDAAWGPAEPLPGKALGRPAGPVVAAAGLGAATVAWRIDTPKRYQAIGVMARDPGGTFSAPAIVSPADANGVRHPAVAVDGAGRGVLAYNTDTRKVHLSLKGAVAVSLRDAHGSFGEPVVVDQQSSGAPAVAIGSDGRGIVTWLRDRRVWAASVDVVAGRVGRATAVTAAGSYQSLRAAAGPGGAATIAFRARKPSAPSALYTVAAVRRIPGGRFAARPQIVDTIARRGFVGDVALAADEDGNATLAWSPEDFGTDRSVGLNGVTSGVRAAVAGADTARFGKPRDVAPRGSMACSTPAVAAQAAHSALAWVCRDRKTYTVFGAILDPSHIGAPKTILTTAALPISYAQALTATAGLDGAGQATVIAVRPNPTGPATATERVLASTGR